MSHLNNRLHPVLLPKAKSRRVQFGTSNRFKFSLTSFFFLPGSFKSYRAKPVISEKKSLLH